MSFAGPFDTAVEDPWCAMAGPRPAPGSACVPRTGPKPASAGGVHAYDVFVGCYKTGAIPDALVEDWARLVSRQRLPQDIRLLRYAHSAVEATLELLGRLQQRKVDEIAEIWSRPARVARRGP